MVLSAQVLMLVNIGSSNNKGGMVTVLVPVQAELLFVLRVKLTFMASFSVMVKLGFC